MKSILEKQKEMMFQRYINLWNRYYIVGNKSRVIQKLIESYGINHPKYSTLAKRLKEVVVEIDNLEFALDYFDEAADEAESKFWQNYSVCDVSEWAHQSRGCL